MMNGVSPKLMFVFVLLLLFLSGFEFSSRAEDVGKRCIEKERQALLAIKQQLIDEYGYLSTWGSEQHKRDCCKWRGVSCSNRTGHVVSLNLSFGDGDIPTLGGNLSASLVELHHLNYLNLSYNDFGRQQIPEFIGSLKKLRHLDLSYAFEDRIPYQLGNLSRLQFLDLSSSFSSFVYTDKLEWLSNLFSLRYLALNGVNLADATDWLQVVNGLPSLKSLQLRDCNLPFVSTSSIPNHAFSNMTSLMELDLRRNRIIAISDHAFTNMTSLTHLDLSSNGIDAIPKSLTNLCRLEMLDLQYNKLIGQLSNLFLNLSGCTKNSLEILLLGSNKLSGSLPDFIIFSSLKELRLQNNILNGSFPKSFGHPSNLTILDLSSNQLRGSILPDFSAYLSLQELYISDNRLNGTLTPSIGQLSELEVLDLSSNSLEGTITEAHMSNFSKLISLSLSLNSLSLNFSTGWVPAFQLQYIELAGCKLGPQFPEWLQTQNSFSVLDISNAEISDIIPNWFWDLSPMLFHLNISHNRMSGVLPDLSPRFAGYPGIDLSHNCFEGSIPPVPTNVTALIFSNNMFSGSISFLCASNCKNLVILDLSSNQLSGELPSCFEDWPPIVDLANNKFSGKIPDKMDLDCGIEALNLRNNSLIGELPSSLKNCYELQVFALGNNKLSGPMPPWIPGSLPKLVVLSLRSNQFQGSIPIQLCNLTNLQVLDFSRNNISGTIPKCLNNLTALTSQGGNLNPTIIRPVSVWEDNLFDGGDYLSSVSLMWKGIDSEYRSTLGLVKSIDLSSNKLYGKIPSEISTLLGLISLNFSKNSLSGPIPTKIGQLNLLNTLDLSNNLLSGEIPESFSQLDALGFLNLSNNNLSGEIPSSTKPQSFDASRYGGNPRLCGPPLPNKCSEDGAAQEPHIPFTDDEDGLISRGFYVSLAFGFFTGFWVVCGTLVLKQSWRYAYFKFLNDMKDKAYVFIAVNVVAKLQRKLGN